MGFLDTVVLPNKQQPSGGGSFLSTVKPPPADYVPPKPAPAPQKTNALMSFVHSIIDGPVERATAIIDSIKQGSLEPLKQSLSKQLSAKTPVGTTSSGKPLSIPTVVADLAAGFGSGDAPASLLKERAPLVERAIEKPEGATKPAAQSQPVSFLQSVVRPEVHAELPEGSGATKTSTLAESVEAQAVQRKLTDNFGDLPQYQQVSMKEQAELASDLVASNYEHAKSVALGKEKPSDARLLPESVFTAVEQKALSDGDVSTLKDLATKSTLSTEATAMGQRIRALAERDTATPVSDILDVQRTREAAYEKQNGVKVSKAKQDTVAEIKAQIKKPSRQNWDDFIQEIQCNY